MAKLVCQAGPDAGHEYPLNKEKTVFGRRSGCEVQILDSMASREHFMVRRDGKLFTCIDMESRNGTRVNGRKVTARQLEFGDRIRIGEVEYLFVKEEGDVELRDLLTSKYEILEKIGEGGMGVVYKAKQRSMDRTVALKVLTSKYASRPKFVQRFIDEARAAGRLNHPNIIQVHDVDSENGIHYFSMEFIDGGTCLQMLRARQRMPPGEALEIIRLTARALQYAHENRLIHRDVKPDNIMLGENNLVKLADLGISKSFDEAEDESRAKQIVGTPHYMAPEAARGARIDHRSDIYSLGVTLYHLLAGSPPLSGKSANDVIKAKLKETPPPLGETCPELPAALCQLVDTMMAPHPEGRQESMAAVITAIDRIQEIDGMQPDLPSGGETLMLRRFASGEETGGDSKPSASAPRDADDAITTGAARPPSARRSTARTRQQAPAALRYALIAVALALGALVALQVSKMIDRSMAEEQSDDAELPEESTGPTPDEIATQRAEEERRAHEELRQRQAGQASALGRRLDRSPDEDGLRAIQRDLEQLSAEAVEELRPRIEELQDRLNQQLDATLARTEQEAFRRVSEEIDTLRAAHDYDAALRRLAAFTVRRSEDVQRRVASLERTLQDDRDRYLDTLRRRIAQMRTMQDADGLRRLRDEELPEALIGSEIADSIEQALREIDQERITSLEAVVDEARAALAQWNWATFDELAAEERGAMGESQPGQRFDRLIALGKEMRAFMRTLDDAIQAATRKPRYRPPLNGVADADIIGAEADVLILRPPSGGAARVPMDKISTAELRTITELVLGEQRATDHQDLIDRIDALR